MDDLDKGFRQFLTFLLDEEVFGIDVYKVREVLDMVNISRVPGMPDFMRGVINVRKMAVPVIDLRKKFGLPPADKTMDTRIVLMEPVIEGEVMVIGAVADAVHEVRSLDTAAVEPPPSIGARWRLNYIKGIGKTEDSFIMILDIDSLFTEKEAALIGEAFEGEKA